MWPHPCLYSSLCFDILQAEEAVKAQHFASTFIFRPGLLDRGDKARAVERWASKILTSTSVRDIAKAMILEAEAGHTGLHVYEGRDILQAAKGSVPVVSHT